MRDDSILAKLGEFADQEEAIASFRFHGTVGRFDGAALSLGGFDRVLWTADCPAIAQTYLPAAPGSSLVAFDLHQLDQRVRPSLGSAAYDAVRQMGFDALEVERDWAGRAQSWRVPQDYPTYGDVLNWFRDTMGYPIKPDGFQATFWAKTASGASSQFLPADYKQEGRLFIVDDWQDLRFLDLSRGEGDLSDPDHLKLHAFRAAEAGGFDGIIINDFAQTEIDGNLGHRSWGIFGHALPKIRYTSVPCVRHEVPRGSRGCIDRTTPEFDSVFLEARDAPTFGPG